ncbi:dTDP-glucose 4,6-dehydratase [Streptomyces davaonensis JCM 4913]|uniref:dTDP-glucose 4,6-dehydratase n=1 Tax=Streptomyces davaonensis (strain DSM 101723 / JCM 4913 / KCC S-0913 / 768) TaxID=1214101 RepID=K4R0N6_STRDJ|nr:dTDP-glucose 4,6-dehydratase [Streptomyces davaonensis]CCK26732.1 dTDP-glucose 4,6-dehydratase [Streptomyces davaonensis JCM 4913]
MTHYLVTGAAGFIGSHFVRDLLGPDGPPDVEVTVLDALTYAGDPANLAPVLDDPRLRFVQGDITDAALVGKLLPRGSVVVNFAAESHVDRSIAAAEAFVRTNVLGTQILLDAALAAGARCFLQVSTDEVYGSIEQGSWTEEAPVRPNSPYAATKAAADLLALSYARTHGLDVRITRCSNNYGPGQHPEKLIPRFVTLLLAGRPVPLYGDGGNIRDWLHVSDHCRAVRLVLERGAPGEVYNIGGGTQLTNRELTGRLLDACGADWDAVRPVEDRKGHDRRYSVDDGKLRRLGHRPRVPFERGLPETVDWYRPLTEHPARRK